ncbi:MAG: hypothetical protein ACE14M_10305 [Terriglobales bacterium]
MAIFWLANWAIFLGLWFLYTNTPKLPELLAGAGAAALAATGSAIVQGQHFARFAPKPKWLALFLTEPWYVITGSKAIVWAMFKKLAGKGSEAQLKAVAFQAGGEDPESAARRALAIALTTIPPNFVVIGIDKQQNTMLIHQVAPSGTPWVTKQLGATG